MKYKTEKQWYASDEHLNTEMSWEEYINKNKKKSKRQGLGLF